ncbi:hypothetical protein Q8A67_013737 [Cirrhinus molitorella]|uniref:Uncharacterized protein n=1 Tax=Cirrhinus molitorella TaxID=172907 RepID=A0AA88PQQ4_9TELE|nr:hypothetical protein Q8A67_013737 [Cirrhinus molitorella]
MLKALLAKPTAQAGCPYGKVKEMKDITQNSYKQIDGQRQQREEGLIFAVKKRIAPKKARLTVGDTTIKLRRWWCKISQNATV